MIRCLVAAAFMIVATSGCVTNGDATSSGSGSPAADAGSVCEATGKSCADCTACAKMTPCATALTACNDDSECLGIDQCVSTCADADCKNACLQSNPDGVADYTALSSCVYCTECPTSCAGFATCM